METFITGLILAAMTGLCVIAYRHPDGYSKLFYFLIAAGVLIFIGIGTFDWGAATATEAISRGLGPEAAARARELAQAIRPNFGLVTIGFIAYGAFLVGLSALPLLGMTSHEEGKKLRQRESDDKR